MKILYMEGRKINEQFYKLAIIRAGIRRIEKDLVKAEKKVEKWSDKLHQAFKDDTSVRIRANLRIKLDNACKERDMLKKMLQTANKWLSDIKED